MQVIANGTKVRINQGFGVYTEGIVRGFDSKKKNLLGWKGNYTIEITGGLDVFSKPAKVGELRTVLHNSTE